MVFAECQYSWLSQIVSSPSERKTLGAPNVERDKSIKVAERIMCKRANQLINTSQTHGRDTCLVLERFPTCAKHTEDSNESGYTFAKLRGFRFGKEETGKKWDARMRSLYMQKVPMYTRGHTLPLPMPTLRPPTTREFGNVDTALAGVESPAKSSRGNLLKISTRRFGYRVFCQSQMAKRERGEEEEIDLIVPRERRAARIGSYVCPIRARCMMKTDPDQAASGTTDHERIYR